jgi:hypothetical protein
MNGVWWWSLENIVEKLLGTCSSFPYISFYDCKVASSALYMIGEVMCQRKLMLWDIHVWIYGENGRITVNHNDFDINCTLEL